MSPQKLGEGNSHVPQMTSLCAMSRDAVGLPVAKLNLELSQKLDIIEITPYLETQLIVSGSAFQGLPRRHITMPDTILCGHFSTWLDQTLLRGCWNLTVIFSDPLGREQRLRGKDVGRMF